MTETSKEMQMCKEHALLYLRMEIYYQSLFPNASGFTDILQTQAHFQLFHAQWDHYDHHDHTPG